MHQIFNVLVFYQITTTYALALRQTRARILKRKSLFAKHAVLIFLNSRRKSSNIFHNRYNITTDQVSLANLYRSTNQQNNYSINMLQR